MEFKDVLILVEQLGVRSCLVGSLVTCDPPVTNTDIDILVHVPELNYASLRCEENGYHTPEDYDDIGKQEFFRPFRKDRYNLLLTSHTTFYDDFVKASNVAKLLNLTVKADRKKLFKYLVDGKTPEGFVCVENLLVANAAITESPKPTGGFSIEDFFQALRT